MATTVKDILKTPKDRTQFKKWLQALRSGKYKQTQDRLEDTKGGTYCCLGVACKILVPEEQLKKQVNELPGGMFTKGTTVTIIAGTKPTDQVAAPQWLKDLEMAKVGPKRQSVMVYNDSDKLSFKQIADILEAEVK